MGPLRRLNNGRSPLVNKQSQITAFFTPNKSASTPSPSPSPGSIPLAPPNPNPSPKSNPPLQQKKPLLVIGSGTTSSTPSPNSNPPSQKKKSLLVIGSATTRSTPSPNSDSKSKAKSPESGKRLYGEEVVGKRVRVYWPLDETWYDGCVKSFDSLSGKHLIQYEDAEEEELEIEKEKIEWVEEEKKSFRRLKRKSVNEDVVVEEGGSVERKKFGRLQRNLAMEKDAFDEEEEKEGSGGDDDSEDEDWGKNVAKESVEDDSEDMDLEDEEEDEGVGSSKKARGTSSQSRKRKVSGDKTSFGKKSKGFGKMEKIATKNAEEVNGGKLVEPVNNVERHSPNFVSNALTGDVAERYTLREAEKLPFLGVERRDAKRRRPGDLDYDLRTLYLPSDFLKGLSGGQRQWWDFKSKHMDKVMFFKMGKFYELFEMDAHIGAKELDLQYMKGDQPHVGFPEKNFTTNVEKLARKGYRVLIIEQTETPEQLDIRRKEKGSKDKVVKREICGLITKGTLTEGEMLATNPDAFYLMAVTESFQVTENHKENVTFGVCLVDVSTSMFLLGQFTDDSERSSLCSLLSELRPVEIIKPAKVISPESEKVLLRHTRNPLVNELVPVSEFWNADKTIDEVRTIYMRLKNTSESGRSDKESFGASDSEGIEDYSDHLPNILSELVSAGESGSSALSALGGCLFYLRQSFLDETLLRCAKFELLPCSGFRDIPQKPYLVLDSAAIENLEIFENNRNGGSSGTLFTHLNHCVTAFGKRLLKDWIARPLYHAESIKERQDAVAILRGNVLAFVLDFRKELSRLPDMERLLARLFASSEGNGRNANKVVLYEDASKKQLKEFVTALRGCELLAGACSSFSAALDSVESGLLRHLLTPGQGLPDICSVLNHFKNAFDWTEADSSGRIIPRKGVDTEYDSACKAVKEVEANLARHLNEQRDLLGDESINYVTVGKDLYLLEVPESMQSKVPRDYELRSSKKGFFRYWTLQIKKLLGELSPAEAEKESKLKTILQRLIGRFCEHHIKWRQMISAAAELDVLMSLAIVSDYYEGPTCRPTIVNSPCSSEVPCLLAKSLGHPVLRSDALGKGTFVPNDATIGGSGNASFILLTGPNMGGKSTLLRQVCMAVILAQLGADVPAEYFELSPVDRIFVRMGARDHIMAGQSTFLTELSETASMLSSATCNSLVVLDELGRGTSTSDGQAIAESVLEHFVHKVNCRGMFSTHYHRLAVDYQEDPQVSLCHMACKVEKGTEDVEEVTFLYRLTQGACPKSYGVNVARLAGLPDSILQKAAAKSGEFEAMYGKNKQGRKELSGHSLDKSLAIILQDLVNILSNSTCNKTCDGNGIGSLAEIHKRARLLMQGS